MGMNNEAFQIGASKGATVSGTNVITEGVEVPTDHISAGTDEVQPKFSIKFTDFKVQVDAATNKAPQYNIKLTIDGQTVNFLGTQTSAFTATNAIDGATNSANGPLDVDGTDVATDINGHSVQIGKDVYLASNTTGTVEFTWKGTFDGTTYVDESTAKVTEDTWVPQGAVNITIGAGTNADGVTPSSQHADCKVTKVNDPVVGGDNLRAGASLDISKIVEALKNGSELKIGETTFKLDSSVDKDTVNGAAATGYTIGTKDVADDDLVQYITEQMSNKDVIVKKGTQNITFNINRESDSKIHIDEDETSGTAGKYEGFTKAELEKVFSTVDKASNAYTTFKVTDNDKMGDTEKITIDGKDYEFAKGATADATLANLKTALGNAYQVSDPSGGSITIKATSATADAPAIAGSGLTLQIGDTADPYNKMTIKVADMSANGLGLEELKKTGIMTENKASDAIDKIKAAINTVSTTRAGMGALQNRLEHTINNLDVAAENLSAANSR
ncbi:MAG: hypothetical protein HDT27_10780, partial [Subdoligranulum sp.]|nr:hypothetical protein [Subdoligranulum sp.]